MAHSQREVLLEEARDRHKLELARYTEAHTRIGVHLAVLAVFALALLRFIDKPPLPRGSFIFCLFAVSAVVLCAATLVVFGFVLAVIWGYGTRFPASSVHGSTTRRSCVPRIPGLPTPSSESRKTWNST